MSEDAKDAAYTSWGPNTAKTEPTSLSAVETFCDSCYLRLGELLTALKVFENRVSPLYEAHVVRALMYVVRDLSEDMSLPTSATAETSLERLLVLCHTQGKTPSNAEDRELRDVIVCAHCRIDLRF